MEAKELIAKLDELKSGLETYTKSQIEASIKTIQESISKLEGKADKTEVAALQTTLNEIKEASTKFSEWQVKKDEADKKNQEALDKLILEGNKKPVNVNGETKSFNDILGEAIEKNADTIKGFKKGDPEVKIDLMPDLKAANPRDKREVKTVGDMSISGNFPAAIALYQDRQNALIQSPYNRVWLSDVLPNGTSNGTSIIYPKENGGEGGAALWTDRTADKAEIDYDLTTQTAYFKWIAGYVIVDRDMLDDVPFLLSYLQNKMLISLKTAENDFILNGSSDSNPVDGLLDAATAYNGSYTNSVDRIIDAAWGQIVEDTEQFYSPTNVIIMPRDAVKIGINKASGSGEYNLPAGSVAFVNGKLTIGGLEAVTTTSVGDNTFIALDKSATMFVRRLVPELRMFEDSTLAKKNRIMFRIEERATLAIFNDNAIVTGALDGSGS